MTGASFVRADLHVHTIPDGADEPVESAIKYVRAAVGRGVAVLAVTDHNQSRNVRAIAKAARGQPLLIVPGIEVNSRDGHLIGLFGPAGLDALDGFSSPEVLDLGPVLPDGTRRSAHTMLHLLNELNGRGGIGIIAHADASGGIQSSVSRGDLAAILTHPGLAGIEFRELVNLQVWFSDVDPDDSRREAWQARQRNPELRDRGLALVMSSDAHDSSLVGKDGADRPLTRLRVGELTFTAVRNALVNNPKARCKVEAALPATYPSVTSVRFEGGFLDSVEVEFAQNLNCFIGGRGSGKSTALLALRAALGATIGPDEDDPDDARRMPERTIVRFVDAAGTERVAVRERGDIPRDEAGVPIELALADLSQGESGQVASSYRAQPLQMLAFLDGFCRLDAELDAERAVLDRLNDNAAEVLRTAFRESDLKVADEERRKLEANIRAAEKGKLEDIAIWALRLATQNALIEQVRLQLGRILAAKTTTKLRKLSELADETKTDLAQRPIKDVAKSLDQALMELSGAVATADTSHKTAIVAASAKLEQVLKQWDAEYARWEKKRRARQAELEAEGLKVQAGALTQMGSRFEVLTKRLADLEEKRRQHVSALAERKKLLEELAESRRLVYERRKRTLKLITKRANDSTLGLEVFVSFTHEGIRRPWREWLGPGFHFKGDRLGRLALAIKPSEFARHLTEGDLSPIAALVDAKGDRQPFFTTADMEEIAQLSWDDRFGLETMMLEDLPRIDVKDSDHGAARELDQLSAGQQRSVLLSLLLCADRSDPLIIDQPEDHLDAPYVASGVVRHLEQAKERRQVIIATHNANLTVLGDAELVIPLYAEGGKGLVKDAGAVDDAKTLGHVCRLLEGGASAYERRGRRYGFAFSTIPVGL